MPNEMNFGEKIGRMLAPQAFESAEAKVASAEARAAAAEQEATAAKEEAAKAKKEATKAQAQVADLEKQIAQLREQLAEAQRTPEEKTDRALRELRERAESNPDSFKISRLFSENFFGFARDYLKDPEVVAAIVKEYPESITDIPTKYFAENYESLTTSFIDGVREILSDPEGQQHRTVSTAMTEDENHKHIDYNRETHVENITYNCSHAFKTKTSTICLEAKKHLDLFPDPQIKPSDIKYDPYLSAKAPEDATVEAQFLLQLQARKQEASLAASILAGKNKKQNNDNSLTDKDPEPGEE